MSNMAAMPRTSADESRAHLARSGMHQASDARQRVLTWQQLIKSNRDARPYEKLLRVNNFFNRLEFVNDKDLWGMEDYWATPIQMLSSNGGDCEDFSIAKYFTLISMGIAEEQLRLTYVRALDLDQAHMVLSYYPPAGAEPLILDNLNTSILPASRRTDLRPVYSFNGDGLWLARRKGKDERVGGAARLSRWKEVVARISHEHMPPIR